MRLSRLALLFVAAGLAPSVCAEVKSETPAAPPTPAEVWTNAKAVSDLVTIPDSALSLSFAAAGKDGKPYRTLWPESASGKWYLRLPPQTTVQGWKREELARHPDTPLAVGAKWGAFPAIFVGPYGELPRAGMNDPIRELTPWRESATTYRAYPEGPIQVLIRVKNEGTALWKEPRVRLLAPDSWNVQPDVAPLTGTDGAKLKRGLAPTTTGVAAFTISVPRNATLNHISPMFAFLRFAVDKKEITAQNSVDIRTLEPIDRRYGMDEDGRKLLVHLVNRFRPTNIGSPVVEVRNPSGADWGIVQPAIEPLQSDRDAVAVLTKRTTPPDPLSIPVVVTLNGLRMGYTPTVSASIRFGADARSAGITSLAAAEANVKDPSAELTLEGSAPAIAAFAVTERFAVSDPEQWVSPTWVTVEMADEGKGRIRLEYDAYGSDGPVVAADIPLPAPTGQTLSFLLPDARFAGRLRDKADLRLVVTGRAVIREIRATKWNPVRPR